MIEGLAEGLVWSMDAIAPLLGETPWYYEKKYEWKERNGRIVRIEAR